MGGSGAGEQQPVQLQPMAVSCSQVNEPLKSPHVPAMHVVAHSVGGGRSGGAGGGGGSDGGGIAGEQQPVQSQPVTRIASQVIMP